MRATPPDPENPYRSCVGTSEITGRHPLTLQVFPRHTSCPKKVPREKASTRLQDNNAGKEDRYRPRATHILEERFMHKSQ